MEKLHRPHESATIVYTLYTTKSLFYIPPIIVLVLYFVCENMSPRYKVAVVLLLCCRRSIASANIQGVMIVFVRTVCNDLKCCLFVIRVGSLRVHTLSAIVWFSMNLFPFAALLPSHT